MPYTDMYKMYTSLAEKLKFTKSLANLADTGNYFYQSVSEWIINK